VQILALETTDFRNLSSVLIEPHPRFNVLYGDNGQGKTNLLEAVYLLGTLRSFRASKTEEMLTFGKMRARVRARVRRLGIERLLEVGLSRGHKSARIDGKGARAFEYFGGFNVVLFAPEDLRLTRGAPVLRRRHFDRTIFNARPSYLAEAQTYERVLRSRNAVLRDRGPESLLEVYDAQLCAAAAPIVTSRRAIIAALRPRIERAFERLTRTGLSLEMSYETRTPGDGDALQAGLAAQLIADRGRDRARGATSVGPHTDDVALFLDRRPARLYASQGQTRALVLAMKIAEIEHLTDVLAEPPVLLLDDVSSELDATRNAQLFEFLGQVNCQAFITTTHPVHVKIDGQRRDFSVAAGQIA
jgi:DNA replication and repair protein RecF